MKTMAEMITGYVKEGMTINQAESYTCQKVVLSKMAKSTLADKILIKGGVVMFNRTGNLRRATGDLDFDFIRYDISEKSIRSFVSLLNRYDSRRVITVLEINPLHQEDYQGKRVLVRITDGSANCVFKMDIGVHTLLAIKQDVVCFTFMDREDGVMLGANPPEQIFAEKAYSLAKHGSFSGRGKDVFDMYYLLKKCHLDKTVVNNCLGLLTFENKRGVSSVEDVRDFVEEALNDPAYRMRLSRMKEKWIDESIEVIATSIVDYLYDLC